MYSNAPQLAFSWPFKYIIVILHLTCFFFTSFYFSLGIGINKRRGSYIDGISLLLSCCLIFNYIFGITYHRQHFHESQQIDEHHTGRGHTELHLEERDRALAIAPDGHQDEQGGSALEEAAGAAGYHEDGATGRVVGRGLEMQLSKGGKQLAIQTSSETKRNDGQSRPNAGAKKATEY